MPKRRGRRPPAVDHTLFEHASVPATVTQQFIGDARRFAPYLREQNANSMLKLLEPIPPRLDWPAYKASPRVTRMRAREGPASALQLEHAQELHAVLAHRLPDVARGLNPRGVRTKRDAAAFLSQAMTALHDRAGYA